MGNKLTVVDDNVRECFQTPTEGRQRRRRDHIVRQTVPNGMSTLLKLGGPNVGNNFTLSSSSFSSVFPPHRPFRPFTSILNQAKKLRSLRKVGSPVNACWCIGHLGRYGLLYIMLLLNLTGEPTKTKSSCKSWRELNALGPTLSKLKEMNPTVAPMERTLCVCSFA